MADMWKRRGAVESVVSGQKMEELERGEGLLGPSASCQELTKINGEKGLP
jgi:hypothetical protein